MTSLPSVDDLRLVIAIARSTSVGSAARDLQISQPSASQRLARLERQVGTRLFERDTRGARPTRAGSELVAQARHILGHLEGVYAATRAAAAVERLRIGTFPSLAAELFPVLDEVLPSVEQVVDHGDQLIDWVAEASMDAAFVAIADQLTMPRGTAARAVGHDELVQFVPAGVPAPRRTKEPFKDRRVVFATYDLGRDEIRSRLIALGADVQRGVTLVTALAIARRRGEVAILPRSAVAGRLFAGERVLAAPFRYRLTLSVVTGPRPAPALLAVLPRLRRELGLTAPRRSKCA